MKNFENFVYDNKIGILYIEKDGIEESEWLLNIDASKLVKDYMDNKITLIDFNQQFVTLLTEQQQNISTIVSEACWNDIEPVIVNELREATNLEDSENAYDNLYDLFDKYEIKIIH